MNQNAAIRSEIDESLASVESRIFQLEESYFNDTPQGNLMKGFDSYLDTKPTQEKKRGRMDPEYRWFSYSSWTFSTQSSLMAQPPSIREGDTEIGSLSRSHKKSSYEGKARDATRGGAGAAA